ncbi:hypothetical protein FIBSPDRAFT_886801 [Athelia psychrophila]|uniref:Uncharacterized protein n=1 Tax=Athelia psychrophila TaxID=1759441 RepID=A0A166QKL2_9AGAM|nr:hypothetical protein FIBSPDRAFT_886801 [Fibularhizoctonia sp. CBS 109695]
MYRMEFTISDTAGERVLVCQSRPKCLATSRTGNLRAVKVASSDLGVYLSRGWCWSSPGFGCCRGEGRGKVLVWIWSEPRSCGDRGRRLFMFVDVGLSFVEGRGPHLLIGSNYLVRPATEELPLLEWRPLPRWKHILVVPDNVAAAMSATMSSDKLRLEHLW